LAALAYFAIITLPTLDACHCASANAWYREIHALLKEKKKRNREKKGKQKKMDTVERGAIRDEKDARLRDGQAGDVEKGGVNGGAGDGEDMMGTSSSLQSF